MRHWIHINHLLLPHHIHHHLTRRGSYFRDYYQVWYGSDDSDEHTGSTKLKLSQPCDLPSDAPMSADVNLPSGDMSVKYVLEQFERERVANKLSEHPVLGNIFGETSDEQFLEVAGLD